MKIHPLNWIAAAVLSILVGTPVYASKIYECTVNGRTVYTSKLSGNCRSADLPSIGSYSSSNDYAVKESHQPKTEKPKNKTANQAAAKASQPAGVQAAPVVPVKNAGGRKAILEQELSNERQALKSAEQSLQNARAAKDGTVNRELIHQLQSSVLDRQQNIQALQRELGRM
ncbi:hypothetical protein [Neisseria weaveri]|uniref:hypothetical protein n=1 Tax=Neisseria weaveri TaxID=28091 RepID=UPI001F233E3B|nr:hypothetical protein [Neisseria weaveri]